MAGTFSGFSSSTYTLTSNPTTVTSTGLIDVDSAILFVPGILGTSGTAWTLTNLGSVESVGSDGPGIYLQSGGSVTNGSATALIEGSVSGVFVKGGAGTVTNYGLILATGLDLPATVDSTGAILFDGGSVTNLGTIQSTGTTGTGVHLLSGGVVTNGTRGSTAGLIMGYQHGVAVNGATGTIINFGTIAASGATINGDIYLSAGGSVTNGASGAAAGLIIGAKGVIVAGGVGTVTNYGTIKATGSTGQGVNITGGGLITNGAIGSTTALIESASGDAIRIQGGAGTLTNLGTIQTNGTLAPAVFLGTGGTLTNRGLITSMSGAVNFSTAAGTVDNFGSIVSTLPLASTAGGAGVYLGMGGLITNEAGASVYAERAAVSLAFFGTTSAAATVSNSGTITGNTGVSIGPADTGSNTIINYGTIIGTGGTAISLGTVGTELVVIGTNSSLDGVITNVQISDRFDLPFLTYGSGGSYLLDPTTHVLQVTESSTSFNIDLDPSQSLAGDTFRLAQDGGTGTNVTVACFCRGTRILTDKGEVAVEDLAIGDRVVVISGAARPVKWIGRRSYDGRFVAGNRAVLPIRIAAGAIADGLPVRDLWVSPEHALSIDGALVPARHLVNGLSVTQTEAAEAVEYFHIELDAHDILFAEGMPAESFVDCDNRGMFQNAGEFARLYPDDIAVPWQFCAKRLEEASAGLTAIRAWLRARAEALGYATTADPGLHLIADGAALPPQAVEDGVYRFAVPAGSRALWLASRSVVPAALDTVSQDHRRLGVALERIVLRDDDLRVEVGCAHAALREGFHDDEGTHRWTDGMALLPVELLRPFAGGGGTLEVRLTQAGLRYPLAGAPHRSSPPAPRAAAGSYRAVPQ